MLKVFCSPSRYVQGANATAELGAEMRALGLEGPALVVAGSSANRLLAGIWAQTFSAHGYDYSVFSFAGECTAAEIARGANAGRGLGAGVIVGAGGGKVLDTARAIAADLGLPIVNCPTLASSDAPCSALSVIYTAEGAVETYRVYRRNPDLVLVDTSVIARSPVRTLVAGMGDALSTVFEARACVTAARKNMRGGLSTRSALALAELCYQTLLSDGTAAVEAARRQQPDEALERVVEANTLLSGLGFESSGLAAAHAIHNGLTAAPQTHDRLHGEKVAFGVLTQLLLENQPQSAIEEVLAFSSSVGLPVTLAEIGINEPTPELIRAMAERATAQGETIHNEPMPVTAALVEQALLAADAAGQAWLSARR